MGYLDNSTVTVDAILTNKGRQLLAAGQKLNIVKFALSDDEIDYDLWNPTHTLGTNYYGAVIENMPVLEALPDETQMMRYKLVTLPKTAVGIPVVSAGNGITSITFNSVQDSQVITPTTLNDPTANATLGFTAIIADGTVAKIEVVSGAASSGIAGAVAGADAGALARTAGGASEPTTTSQTSTDETLAALANSATSFIDDSTLGASTGASITKVGKSFRITPLVVPAGEVKRTLLTLIANESGGFITIPITVTGTLTVNPNTGRTLTA